MDNEIFVQKFKKRKARFTFVWVIILYPRAYRQIIVI